MLPCELRNDTPRDDSCFFSGELADGVAAVPALRSGAFRHDLAYESKLLESSDYRTYLSGGSEGDTQQLSMPIDFGLVDSNLRLQARQHGRESRASAEARCCASGESVKSEDDIGRHDAIVGSRLCSFALEGVAG